MSRPSTCLLHGTLTPFLYPFSGTEVHKATRLARRFLHPLRSSSTSSTAIEDNTDGARDAHLNPDRDSYSSTPFTDNCTVTITAGGGGNGCVAFLREKYIEHGPPNGGDGGTGGNIYIQAMKGETSLHKVARRNQVKAGKGKNGMGTTQSGHKGTDVIITVPVGTVIRELARYDPIDIEEEEYLEEAAAQKALRKSQALADTVAENENEEEGARRRRKKAEKIDALAMYGATRREKWLMYPGEDASKLLSTEMPPMPKPRRSNLATVAPPAPMHLDLDEHMETPRLLAAGAMGGYGNPHFITREDPRPKVATKGDDAIKIILHMELKLLADVGLVGLPNAGKSTLLRAVSNSRARVGNWAFTTLQPNIGTVVLDDYKGRSKLQGLGRTSGRTRFTIADIPGVIEDAHKDKGLGLSFLRHIERARVLAFVIDLSAGDAVTALKALWTEVTEYENLGETASEEAGSHIIDWEPTLRPSTPIVDEESILLDGAKKLPALALPPMSSKPWFVVATKADLEGTRENFERLQGYLRGIVDGEVEHPSKKVNAWRTKVVAVPVSGIRGEGVELIPSIVVDLLEGWYLR